MYNSENAASMENIGEQFGRHVDMCHKRKLDRWITNDAINHATYLLYKLLDVARKSKRPVRIVSGSLDKRVYNQLEEMLRACIKVGVRMQVVVLDEVDGDADGENKFYDLLKEYEGASCYNLQKTLSSKIPHMLVVGDRSFRYETDTDTHSARANFNSPDFAKVLNHYFDSLIQNKNVVMTKSAA